MLNAGKTSLKGFRGVRRQESNKNGNQEISKIREMFNKQHSFSVFICMLFISFRQETSRMKSKY
jgi:membrane protein DedA with SNARE-associated domain